MRIKKEHLQTLWYEDNEGNYVCGINDIDISEGPCCVPKNAEFQVSRFPCEVTTKYIKLNEDGTSTQLMGFNNTYSEDLAVAIYNDTKYSLGEAIIIAATSCERCMNALAHKYGLDWGYPEDCEEYKNSGTSCQFCE